MALRIAFYPLGGKAWPAGTVYLKNLLAALKTTYGDRVTTILLTAAPQEEADYPILLPYIDSILFYDNLKSFKKVPKPAKNSGTNSRSPQTHRAKKNAEKSSQSSERVAANVLGEAETELIEFLRQHRIDLVFCRGFSTTFKIATLGWLPDFQYLHLPEMFGEQQLQVRIAKDRALAETVTTVMLSSQSAQRDFCTFAPEYAHKAAVVPFVVPVPPETYELDLQSLCAEYTLPERFIYLPNQFWKHKNHRVAFDALRILKGRGVEPFLVCTGNLLDHRNPDHFPDLLQLLSRWGLREQVAFLGMIPHEQVYGLMRQSLCILNPSRFEGWSTTVEEARSLGKRLVLSDLPVHREQNPPETLYFDPQDPEALAHILESVWRSQAPGPDLQLEAQARSQLDHRIHDFAENFYRLAEATMEENRRQQLPRVAHAIPCLLPPDYPQVQGIRSMVWETLATAQAKAQDLMTIAPYAIPIAGQEPELPEFVKSVSPLERSHPDSFSAKPKHHLPLLKDVLDQLYASTDAEYIIYTPDDTVLLPHFYLAIEKLLQAGHDAIIFRQRSVSDHYNAPHHLPAIFAEVGKRQLDIGCFVFRREIYPQFDLGTVFAGTTWGNKALMANIRCHAQNFKVLQGKRFAFRIGSKGFTEKKEYQAYHAHSQQECLDLVERLKSQVSDERVVKFLGRVHRWPKKREKPIKRKFAHIINPVAVNKSSDLHIAQPITFETMRQAQQTKSPVKLEIKLFSTQYPEDRKIVPNGFKVLPDLERSVLDVGNFEHPRKLPLLKDILDRLYTASEAEFFIYTNVDISLLPNFYVAVDRLVSRDLDAVVINRRTIPARFDNTSQIPLMCAEIGEPHAGFDCFIFRRDAYPKYDLGNICVGAKWVGRALLANLICHSKEFKVFTKKHLTFHIGDDRPWTSQDNDEFRLHNERECLQIIKRLQAQTTDPMKLEFLKALPEESRFEQKIRAAKGLRSLKTENGSSGSDPSGKSGNSQSDPSDAPKVLSRIKKTLKTVTLRDEK